MASTLANPAVTRRDDSPVTPRPTPAKADIRPQLTVPQLSPLVMESVKDAHGKQEAAAVELGKDPGNLNRDLKRAAALLEGLGPDFLTALGVKLQANYGPLASKPAARVRRVAVALRDTSDELMQLADYIEEVA